MNKIFKKCALLTLSLSSFYSHADLARRFELETYRNSVQPQLSHPFAPRTQQALEGKSFLLIDGMLGDLTQNMYAKDVAPYLKSQLNTEDVSILRPSSFNTLEENARAITLEIRVSQMIAQRRGNQKPLIILAHSRGAAELMIALLMNPELLNSAHIEQVIFIQGAFGGSPLAEWVKNHLDPLCEKSLGRTLSEACSLVRDLESINTLVPEESLRIREKHQAQLRVDQKEILFQKVSFVRAQVDLKKASLPLKPSTFYLSKFFGANDGVLLTQDEKVEGVGLDLGILEVDHVSLMRSTSKRPKNHEAFLRALFGELLKLGRLSESRTTI